MIKAISTLRSGTLHGLIVAAVAYLLQAIGLAEQFPDNEAVVNGILNVVEIAGMVYAAIRRTFFPNPPLTETAVAKEVSMIENGKLEVRK